MRINPVKYALVATEYAAKTPIKKPATVSWSARNPQPFYHRARVSMVGLSKAVARVSNMAGLTGRARQTRPVI